MSDNISSYFYARQIEQVIQQIIRVFSGFKYKTGADSSGLPQLLPVPCKYGDISRMVAQIMRNNSENVAMSAPMFAVWIKDINMAPNRRKGPVLENTLMVTERAIDPITGRYTDQPGNSYEINRLMPVPLDIKINVDLLTTNTDQHWQLLEQMLLLFNPNIEIQANENPFDWTYPIWMTLENINYNSKSIPLHTEDQWNVASLTFNIDFWLSPPAKVKRLVPIHNIIIDVGRKTDEEIETWTVNDFSQMVKSVADYKVTISGNTAILQGKFNAVHDDNGNVYSWSDVLNSLGYFDPNTTILRLRPTSNIEYTKADIIAHIALDNNSPNILNLSFDESTFPATTITDVNNIIDPRVTYPNNGISASPTTGVRYLILKQIIANTFAWGNFSAPANSIIEWNGSSWIVSLNPADAPISSIVKNLYNNKLYVLINEETWISCIEGIYTQGYWALQFYDKLPIPTDKTEF